MSQYIVDGEVYIERRFVKKTIKIEDEKITVLPPDVEMEQDAEIYHAAGKKVVPGFIDVHTHGAVGVDVNAATAEDYEKICRFAADVILRSCFIQQRFIDIADHIKLCVGMVDDGLHVQLRHNTARDDADVQLLVHGISS